MARLGGPISGTVTWDGLMMVCPLWIERPVDIFYLEVPNNHACAKPRELLRVEEACERGSEVVHVL